MLQKLKALINKDSLRGPMFPDVANDTDHTKSVKKFQEARSNAEKDKKKKVKGLPSLKNKSGAVIGKGPSDNDGDE